MHEQTNDDPWRFYQSDNRLYSDGQLLDFDIAVLNFMDWMEAKQEEQVIGRQSGRKLKDGETYVRKYRDMASIFREYYADETPVIRDPTKTGDPLVDTLSIEDVMAGWNPND